MTQKPETLVCWRGRFANRPYEPSSSLVSRMLRLSSRTCSKVLPRSSCTWLTRRPCSSRYSSITGRSATRPTTSSSRTPPLSSYVVSMIRPVWSTPRTTLYGVSPEASAAMAAWRSSSVFTSSLSRPLTRTSSTAIRSATSAISDFDGCVSSSSSCLILSSSAVSCLERLKATPTSSGLSSHETVVSPGSGIACSSSSNPGLAPRMAPIRSSGTLLWWSALISRPFREPLCQAGVIGGSVAPPGVLEDVLAETGRLGELHVVTHGGQHSPGEVALQLLQDLGALSYPAVVERGDYAALQGPLLPVVLHLLHAADEIPHPLQCQCLHGDRYKEFLDVEQAVDVEHVPRRRRVEQHEIVAVQAV